MTRDQIHAIVETTIFSGSLMEGLEMNLFGALVGDHRTHL